MNFDQDAFDTYSESISISVSKNISNETEDERRPRIEEEDSISDEFIRKNEWILDTYQVTSEPIHGGMGSVWKVHHKGWNVDLAMKRPQRRYFAEGSERRKKDFIEECSNWIGLGLHPNPVSCYYVREIGGVPSIFSEWMDNGSLKDRIADGGLYKGSDDEKQERLLSLAIQALRGLRYSNENNLIHQDMKPGNLLLTCTWEAKVADFGLAKASATLEGNRRSAGYTIAYCPREQAEGADPEEWMDIYAWALTVLEMYLGGRKWKTGSEAKEHCAEYFDDAKVPVPSALRELLVRCLKETPRAFEEVEGKLTAIYEELTGEEYPEIAERAAADTADSLNNRALSYLDLGKVREAEDLWEKALEQDPHHVNARFNRELYRLRFHIKYDYEVIADLNGEESTRAAGVAKEIEREWNREKPIFPSTDKYSTSGRATGACISGEYLYLTFGDEYRPRVSPFIRRVKKDDPNDFTDDPLVDLRMMGESARKISIGPGGKLALILLRSFGACLYDMRERTVLKTTWSLPLETMKNICDDAYGTFCVWSPDARRVAVYTGKDNSYYSRTMILEIPTLEVLAESRLSFAGFAQQHTPLLEGDADNSGEYLFILEEDGTLRKFLRFDQDFRRICERLIPVRPFLLYSIRSGDRKEIMQLDQDLQKVPVGNGAENVIGRALLHDPFGGYLYTGFVNINDRYFGVWDIKRGEFLFSTGHNFVDEVLYDELQGQIICLSADENNTRWSEMVPLPKPVKGEEAKWKLSRIVSAKEQFEENDLLSTLARKFRKAYQKSDYAAVLACYREALEMPGFYGSRVASEMEDRIDKVLRKRRLRTVRRLPDIQEYPQKPRDFKGIQTESGLTVVFGDTKPCRKLQIYGADGNFVREVELPDFVNLTKLIGDRLYAFRVADSAVYDLEGNLLEAPEDWGPVPRWKEMPDNRKSPILLDVDPSVNYLLYIETGKEDYDGNPVTPGFFLKNPKTGEVIRLSDYVYRRDRFSAYSYKFLKDGKLLVRIGNSICRIDPVNGKTLQKYKTGNFQYNRLYVRVSPGEEQLLILSEPIDGDSSEWYGFNLDGKQFFHEKTSRNFIWMPGGRFVACTGSQGFEIRDIQENRTVYSEKTDSTYDLSFGENGRILYARESWKSPINVYRLEYDYE